MKVNFHAAFLPLWLFSSKAIVCFLGTWSLSFKFTLSKNTVNPVPKIHCFIQLQKNTLKPQVLEIIVIILKHNFALKCNLYDLGNLLSSYLGLPIDVYRWYIGAKSKPN